MKIKNQLRYIHAGLHVFEKKIDALRRNTKKHLGMLRNPSIEIFRGFGNENQVLFWGRVLEKSKSREVSPESRWYANTRSMYRRFKTDEIPGATVSITVGNKTITTESDVEGYFQVWMDIPWQDVDYGWNTAQAQVSKSIAGKGEIQQIPYLIVSPNASYGVISDIDDTILESDVTDFFRMVRLALFNNIHTRNAFLGAPALYQAMSGNQNGDDNNPTFYISSSVWNMYDYLEEFFDVKELPRGPLLLRHRGLDRRKVVKTRHEHKLEKMRLIFKLYPHLPFVLFGDSGQHDVELYAQAAQDHPDQVKAIFIRETKRKRPPVPEIPSHIPFHYFYMSSEAAYEAAVINLITNDQAQWVKKEEEEAIEEEDEKHPLH